MKSYPTLLLAAALFAGGCQTTPSDQTAASSANGNVTVEFKNEDNFTDVKETANGPTSKFYLEDLSKYLKETASKRLKEGQKLVVNFTDIDLAGDIIPGQRDDIRIIKEIYMPRMTFNFQLLDASGAVIKEGDRRLSDMNYQQNITIIGRNEPLFYDKALLGDWIRRELP